MTLVPQKPAWQAGMTKGNFDPLKEFKKNLVITNEQGVSTLREAMGIKQSAAAVLTDRCCATIPALTVTW